MYRILSSSFWYYIYYNDKLTRADCENYFATIEANEILKEVPTKHKAGLDYLYKRMSLVHSHPCIALWYVFMDDFWDQNKEMEKVKDLDNVFNPKNATSLAYRPKTRADFEEVLNKHGLRDGKKFFSDELMDCLYASMDKYNQEALAKAAAAGEKA